MTHNCGDCAFKAHDSEHCRIFGHKVNPLLDYCSKHNANPQICSVCDNPIVENDIILIENNKMLILCQQCNAIIGTCATCAQSHYCDFESNPSPLPLMVQKKIRQGNKVAVINVPNIARIEITCKNGCECFSPENGCLRQTSQCCNNYILMQELGDYYNEPNN